MENKPVFPMKWHKFLIYFELWVDGILDIVLGALYVVAGIAVGSAVTGAWLIVVMGVLNIAIGIGAIIVRFALARFKTGAPTKLMAMFCVNTAISIMTCVINQQYMGMQITSIVVSVLMIALNFTYYKKREELFVN